MAGRTCICFISLLMMTGRAILAQDTVTVPLHVRAGFDLTGPLVKLVNNELISYRIAASADLTPAVAVTAAAGYTSFHTSKPIYDFRSRGIGITAGADYNFLRANITQGKHYAGIGIRYGLSFYSEEASMIRYTNEWGGGETSLPKESHTGHFVELTPGVRTQLLPGVTIGWNICLRLLISAGAGRDLKPVWMPGYGAGTSSSAAWAEYFVSISLPYKKVTTVVMPKISDQGEDEENSRQGGSTGGTGIRGFTGRD